MEILSDVRYRLFIEINYNEGELRGIEVECYGANVTGIIEFIR